MNYRMCLHSIEFSLMKKGTLALTFEVLINALMLRQINYQIILSSGIITKIIYIKSFVVKYFNLISSRLMS